MGLDENKSIGCDVETASSTVAGEIEDDSLAEVRASVPITDMDVPVNTLRMWVMGTVFNIITSALNQLFELHNPPLAISPYVVIIVAYPVGRFLAWALPSQEFRFFGKRFSLNPGPFNHKEHTVLSIMIIGTGTFNSNSTAADVYTAFYEYLGMASKVTIGYKLMFLLTTQAVAFGMGGIVQRLVVDPAFCVWPAALPVAAMIHGFHDNSWAQFTTPGWKMGRMRFFWITTVAAAVYQFLPGFIFTALSTFAWVTWVAPNNVTVNQIFGSTSGLDLIPLTFDWNQITGYLSNPLVVPGWALTNVGIGLVVILWVITPAIHWSNVWYGQYLPISSASIFDNTGAPYNISRVYTAEFTLDEEAYHAYSPVFLSTTSILSYGLQMAAVVSILVHAWLKYRQNIWQGLRATLSRGESEDMPVEDIHTHLMKAYKPTPTWWYAVSLLVTVGIAIGFVEGFNTGLPWWGVIIALIIQLVLLLPVSIMTAICNQSLSLGVVGGLLGGAIWPGKVEAVVIFKLFLYVPISTAGVLLRDQKLGNYMKVPPRVIFVAQAAGIIISWLTQTGVNTWALANIQGVCQTNDVFTCPLAQSFASSSIFSGLIGPKKLFAPGQMYSSIMYFLLVGAVLPIIVFYGAKRWPRSFLSQVHVPLILSSTASIPPATAINYMPWCIIGLLFNWVIRRRWTGWWLKYNYVFAAGLDAGLGITTFLIFFCLYFPAVTLDWWGNTKAFMTADVQALPLKSVGLGETFGPKTWD